MSNATPFNTLLVPTDFSEASEQAFTHALDIVQGEDSLVIVLHVIDQSIVDAIVQYEADSHEDVTLKLREKAQDQLKKLSSAVSSGQQVDSIVSVGIPFLEIIRKSEDFAVDAIVMGKVGACGPFEKLLFGSTAEKVIRGSRRPIIVLPGPSVSE